MILHMEDNEEQMVLDYTGRQSYADFRQLSGEAVEAWIPAIFAYPSLYWRFIAESRATG